MRRSYGRDITFGTIDPKIVIGSIYKITRSLLASVVFNQLIDYLGLNSVSPQ